MNRYMISAVVFASLCFARYAAAEDATLMGLGTRTCGQFAADYRREPSVAEALYFSWALGYLSAFNLYIDKVLSVDLAAMSVEEQQRYLREYCDKNPLKTYWEGVGALTVKLKYETARNSPAP